MCVSTRRSQIPNAAAIPEDVTPERFDVKVCTCVDGRICVIKSRPLQKRRTPPNNQGKYGVAIVWSDGHYATIYTFDALEKVAARVAAEAAAGGAV